MISPATDEQKTESPKYKRFYSLFILGFLFLGVQVQYAEAVDKWVDTDCANNGDGSASSPCAASPGAAGPWNSWNNAKSGVGTPAAPTIVYMAGTAADTTALDQNGAATSTANYVKYVCDPGKGDGCNTTGIWSTSHYRLSTGDTIASLLIQDEHIRVENLQIEQTGGGDSNRHTGITIDNVTGSTADIRIVGNIIRCSGTCLSSPPTTTDHFGIRMAGSTGKITFANNIIYGFSDIELATQTSGTDQVMNVYNNTLYGAGNRNFYIYADGSNDTLNFKNNLMNGGAGDYQRDLTVTNLTTSNNVTEDTSSPDAAYRSKACTFVDETGRDFNLDSGDSNCKDAGADLSADGAFAFSTDQAGDTRSGTWDIGALEYSSGGPTPTPTATYTPTPTPTATPAPVASTTWGLAWPDGIEPGDPSVCEAPSGKTCYWINCDKITDGTGSYADPDWGFEDIAGYWSAGSYFQGSAVGGDVVYVTGTCENTGSVEDATGPFKMVRLGREPQFGSTTDQPLIIKSWRGTARAVFDGEFTQSLLLSTRSNLNTREKHLRIQNIKFTGAVDSAISCGYYNGGGENAGACDLYSVEINDNLISSVGTFSPILINSEDSTYAYTNRIRNSRIVNNYRNCAVDGGSDGDCAARNNDGAVAVYGTNGTVSAETTLIYGNYFENNTKDIRNKHNGGGAVEVYNNWMQDSEGPSMHVRSPSWLVHHNVILSTGTAQDVFSDEGDANPAGGQRTLDFWNNTVYNRAVTLRTNENYSQLIDHEWYNNAIHSRTYTGEHIMLAMYAGDYFPLVNWVSDHNYWYISAGSQADFSCIGPNSAGAACTNRSFTDTMTYLSDASSSVTDPQFVGAASDNYCLGVGASSRTAGRAGGYIGAIDPADCVAGSGSSTTSQLLLFNAK